jgi:hypothetical protein
MTLALEAPSAQVRAVTEFKLDELRGALMVPTLAGSVGERAHRRTLATDIRRFLDREYTPESRPGIPALPPGAPIGSWDP